jgi:ketosteroid isomerase-like protein
MNTNPASALLLAVTSLVTSGALAACLEESADEASAHVQASFAAWNEAVIQKDLERTMAIFSPSLHFQFQGGPDFGYARLRSIYESSFARENAPQWQPVVENVIGSPQMVTLFNEWKLVPAGGGNPLAEYRGVDVFQREADCEWRVTASLNYADKSALALSPSGHSIGPAEASAGTTHPLVAARAQTARIGEGPR